jgi:hypothetical protein
MAWNEGEKLGMRLGCRGMAWNVPGMRWNKSGKVAGGAERLGTSRNWWRTARKDPKYAENGPGTAWNGLAMRILECSGVECPSYVRLGVKLCAPPVELGQEPVELALEPVELGQEPVELGLEPVELGLEPAELGLETMELGTPFPGIRNPGGGGGRGTQFLPRGTQFYCQANISPQWSPALRGQLNTKPA